MAKMKDSGVEWIGEIPEGWEVKRLKNISTLTPQIVITLDEEQDISFLPMENIKNGYAIPQTTSLKDVWEKSYNLFSNNDILVAKVTPCFENGNIAIAENLVNGLGFATTEVFVIRASSCNIKFLFYFLQNQIFIDRAVSTMTGTGGLKRVSPQFMRDEKLAIPSNEEQQRISAYLDHKCAQIDAILATIQQSIEKLKEYRQAVITRAVTKGLDHDAKMKDSGIEWIGEIPEGWEVTKIKNLYNITLGKMLAPQQKNDDETLEKYLCAANIGENGLNLTEIKEMWFNDDEKKIYKLESGDLLVVEGGNVGLCCQYMGELENCYIQNALHKVTHKEKQNNRFLYYWMKFIVSTEYLNLITNRATIAHYTKEKFSATPIVNVPFVVQQQIVAYLDQKTAQIDSLISEKQKLHDKFTAYKKSLIYEYVTGKREVPDGWTK